MQHNPSIRLLGIARLGHIIARTNMLDNVSIRDVQIGCWKLKTWNSCFGEKIKQFHFVLREF